ncbi:hypothetical protein BAU27_14085 [Bacillus sp. NH11B]|nr:hypothetical protein BAU27_14085 [Bacillus sp. NH11B]
MRGKMSKGAAKVASFFRKLLHSKKSSTRYIIAFVQSALVFLRRKSNDKRVEEWYFVSNNKK